MRLSCKASSVVLATSLALCLGVLPLAACSSVSAPAEDAAPTEEAVEEEVEEETEPEEAVDESVWVKTTDRYTYVSSESEEDNISDVTTYTLDEAGNTIRESHATNDGEWVYNYVNDESGWSVSMTTEDESDPQETVFINECDDAGRVVRTVSGESETNITYDADGNCIKREYTSVAYQVDENYNRVEGTEHEIHSTVTFGADGFITSRLSDWGLPQLYEMAYEYGADGKPVSCAVTVFTLDEDGNRTDEGYVAENVTFSYDENGNVSRIESTADYGTSTTEYEYTLIEHPSLATTINSHLVSF